MKNNTIVARAAMTLLVVMLTLATAWAQQTVYQDGNVSIVQNSGGWQILIGNTVVGHGDGTLDVNNLPPAFQDMLDFYATQKEPAAKKRKLSKNAPEAGYTVYGPYLTTAWGQGGPYNGQCPKMIFSNSEDGTDELQFVTGCSTTATAQILNYYGYCAPFAVHSKTDDITDNGLYVRTISEKDLVEPYISSPYIYDVVKKGVGNDGKTEVSYKVNFPDASDTKYTPNFDIMELNNEEAAKLHVGIAFAQKAFFGTDGTGTAAEYHSDAFAKYYNYDLHETCFDYEFDGNLNAYDKIIAKTLMTARPLLTGGGGNGGGHAYVIDGYNSLNGEYHIDYGWYGTCNGWFTTTLFPSGIRVSVTDPRIANYTHMTDQKVTKVVIRNKNNDTETELTESTGMYEFKTAAPLMAGNYEFYFVYANGSTIAPYTDGKTITLSSDNLYYKRRGTFVSTAAQLHLSEPLDIEFKHNLQDGTISLHGISPRITITGKAYDAYGEPVKGALITTANGKPEEKESCSEVETQGVAGGHEGLYSTATSPIVPKTNYLTKLQTNVFYHSGAGKLPVAIYKGETKVWEGYCLAEGYKEWDKATIVLDNPLKVNKGEPYQLRVTATNVWTYAYNKILDGEEEIGRKLRYECWGTDDFYTTTNDKGEYTYYAYLDADKNDWSGTLKAFSSVTEFNTLTFDNITKNQTDQNFYSLTKFISGKVLDSYEQPVAGAIVSDNSSQTEPWIISKEENHNGWISLEQKPELAFVPQTNYITKIYCQVYPQSSPTNQPTISILDDQKKVVGDLLQFGKDNQTVTLSSPLKVEAGKTYYLRVTYTKAQDDQGWWLWEKQDERYTHKIWGANLSDENGEYTYTVTSPWSGSLHASHKDLTFNTLSFDGITESQSNQDFNCLTKYISGKVLDKENNPIADAMITTGNTKPETSIASQHIESGNGGLRFNYRTEEFTPSTNHLTKIFIGGWIKGSPTNQCYCNVEILDQAGNKKWNSENITIDKFGKSTYSELSGLELDIPYLKVTNDATYQLKISMAGTYDDNNTFVFRAANNKLIYAVWGIDYDIKSDADGNYTYSVVSPWSGTLSAYSGDKKFNSLTFSNLSESMTGQNFKEDATNVEYYSITYKVDGEVYKTAGNHSVGDVIPAIDEPTKEHYVFKGWSPALPTTMPAENLTVDAQWGKSMDNDNIKVEDIQSKTYDGTPYTPTITVKDNGTLLYEGTDYEISLPESRTNVGDYTVTITGIGNYGGSTETTFSITHASLTIKADDKSKAYSDKDPAFTATAIGLLGNETIAYTLFREQGEKVGTYIISVAGGLQQGNYNIKYETGTLTISPKTDGAVTITEDEKGVSVVIDGDSEGDVNFTKTIHAKQVTYKRKFYAGVTTTIILPFEFSEANFDNETFNTLKNVEYIKDNNRWEAHMTPVSKLEANTPYMFKPSETTAKSDGSQTEIVFYNVDIQPTTDANNATVGEWTLQGVYAYQKWDTKQLRIYGFAANNKSDKEIVQGDFVRAGERSYIKATRVYLEYSEDGKETALLSKSATELPERIVVIFDDPSPTSDDCDITTPASEIEPNANIKVWSYEKTIYIEGASGKEYRIVDMSGRPLKTGTATSDREEIRLGGSTGIAIVIVDGKAHKVMY